MAVSVFRRHRRYGRLRQVLAQHLNIPLAVFGHLVDAKPMLPTARRLPDHTTIFALAGMATPDMRPAIDFTRPPYPLYRDGGNPVEQMAVRRMERDAPAMAPSCLISYNIFPESLSQWARRHRFHRDALLETISNWYRVPKIEQALARRLGVSRATLDRFLSASKREAGVCVPATGVDVAA